MRNQAPESLPAAGTQTAQIVEFGRCELSSPQQNVCRGLKQARGNNPYFVLLQTRLA
jgi:hypothetical protein